MNDPLEDLIRGLPLKAPSKECDAKVHDIIRQSNSSLSTGTDELLTTTHEKTCEVRPNSDSISPRSGSSLGRMALSLLGMALSVGIGFMLGLKVNSMNTEHSNKNLPVTELATTDFELTDNVEVVEGQSKTVILDESLQMQDAIPVRKLEMLTRKKIRVKQSGNEVDREIEIPIRKTFFTIAEAI